MSQWLETVDRDPEYRTKERKASHFMWFWITKFWIAKVGSEGSVGVGLDPALACCCVGLKPGTEVSLWLLPVP